MERLADRLRHDGVRVSTPEREETGFDWSALSLTEAAAHKKAFLSGYFDVIKTCDAVLIVNADKHGISGYVGANTLMEAACGFTLGKPVWFLNEIGPQPCQLEAMSVSRGVLSGDVAGFADRLRARIAARLSEGLTHE